MTRPELRTPRPGELLRAAGRSKETASARQSRPWAQQLAEQQSRRALALSDEQRAAIEKARQEIEQAQQDLLAASDLLEAIGAADGPDGVAQAIAAYLTVGLDQLAAGEDPVDPAVLDILYQDIIVSRLLVAEKIITAELLADGAVTARTLNVVHTDPTTGYGIQIVPEGITLLGPEGNPIASIRADGSVAIAVLDDDSNVAGGIDQEGNVVGASVSSTSDVFFGPEGRSLTEVLNFLPGAGQVEPTLANVSLGQSGIFNNNRVQLLVAECVLPGTGPRQIRITHNVDASIRNGTPVLVRTYLYVLDYEPTGFPGSARTTRTYTHAVVDTALANDRAQYGSTYSVASNNIPSDTPGFAPTLYGGDRFWVLLAAATSGAANDFSVHSGQTTLTVEDMGPAVTPTSQTSLPPGPPAGGGDGGGGGTVVRTAHHYYAGFSRSQTRIYQGSGTQYQDLARPAYHAYQGAWGSYGTLRSVMMVPSSLYTAAAGNAGVESVRITLHCVHTLDGQAATFGIGAMSGTTLPGSLAGTPSTFATVTMRPGQTRTITVTGTWATRIVNSNYRRIIIYGSKYAAIDPNASQIRMVVLR